MSGALSPLYFFLIYVNMEFMQQLSAKLRNLLGKKVKNLRREGFLPAVVYGENVPSQSIAVPFKDFEKVYKEAGESTLVTLEVDGKSYNVLINDIAHDPLRGKPLHADFYAVRMDKEIRTKVPVEFFGESPAVKNESGILVKVMQELEIEALPKNLPHELRVDLSGLQKFEDRLLVKNILLPNGVKILAGTEEIIALVEPPRSETELEELKKAEAAPGTGEEGKTEKEVKAEKKREDAVEEEGVKK